MTSTESPPTHLPKRQFVQSVERAAMLLEAIAAGNSAGETVADLARACGLQRATTWRLLSTLESRGFLQSHGSTHRYQLGPALVRLVSSAGMLGFEGYAQELLEALSEATRETANLAMERPTGLTYIAEATPPRVLTASWLGHPAPLHATSSGKAFLAFLTADEVTSHLSGPLPRFTPTTLTDPQAVREELARVRRDGYAVCRGELEDNLYGVSAPVLDERGRSFAVVSVWGPRPRMPDTRLSEFGELAQQTAAAISRRIWSPHPGATPAPHPGLEISS